MENNLTGQKPHRINLVLTIEETNLILESLGQLPFVRVHQLISDIQQQASAQLQNGEKATNAKQ